MNARLRWSPPAALACLGLVLCFWLLAPALNAVHLEGFTAQTQSIAYLKSIAPSVEHDPYLPRVTQYIAQTRIGVVDLLYAVYRVFPNASDDAFRGIVLASFVAVLISAVLLARRWGGTHPLLAFFALILTPGIPETAFFFNDNIVSAAFALVGLALVSLASGHWASLLSGACVAVAILCRLDAIFVLPIMLGAVLQCPERRTRRLVTLVLMFLGAVSTVAASAVVHGFSLVDSFSIATQGLASINNSPVRLISTRLLFFGVAGTPFLLIGGWLAYRRLKERRAYAGIATFIAYPLLLIALAPNVTEIRYVFPLIAPLVAMHGGNGLHWVYTHLRTSAGARTWMARGVAAFALLVMLAPPTFLRMMDGPRSVLGRLWSPAMWMRWQEGIDESLQRARELAALMDNDRQTTLLATHYNDEFYLRLRLMEIGFLPARGLAGHPECRGFSVFTKGRSTVVHIRSHPNYAKAPLIHPYNAALQLTSAFV